MGWTHRCSLANRKEQEIPFRHTPNFFSMTNEEKRAVLALVDECREVIEKEFSPAGYNPSLPV